MSLSLLVSLLVVLLLPLSSSQESDSPSDLFFYATQSGHVERMKTLLNEHGQTDPGEFVNTMKTDFGNWTPLHIAAQANRLESINFLLGIPGIRVNQPAEFGARPVHIAAYWGSLTALHALLSDASLDVSTPDENGCTPLWMAVYGGQSGSVKILIESGKDLRADLAGKNILETGEPESTPLALATDMKETQMVEMIARYLADVMEKKWSENEDLERELEEEEEEEDEGIPVDRDEL